MHSHLSLLLLVNVMTCGLEVCLAVGTIYIPPLLLEAGLEERYMTMVLGVGPVLGLIFVPLIGSASDTWRGRFGRRRPFIWALSLGVLLALVLIPHATSLAELLSLRRPPWLEVSLLVLGIILLQFCGQACFTPLEALVSDLFPGEQESRWAFTVFSLLLSLGGCLGYLLPAVDWHLGAAANYIGSQEAFIYALLTLIFLGCVLSTLLISEESAVSVDAGGRKCRKPWRCCGLLIPLLTPQRLYSAAGGLLSVLPHSLQMYRGMPRVLRRLFLADLCSWMALESFMLFYTDFVGERLYNGQPSAKPGSRGRQLYEEGVRMASLGLFLQCVMSVCCSLVMDRLLARVGPKVLLLSSVALLALSTAVMTLSHSTLLVTIMTATTGITFCTLQVLPYTLTCLYHSNSQVFFPSTLKKPANTCKDTSSTHLSKRRSDRLPGLVPAELLEPSPPFCVLHLPHPEMDLALAPSTHRGMCLDLALLDSAYLLSQVVPSLLMGSLVQLTHNVSAYMASSCVLSVLAVALSSRIVFDWKDMELL